MVIRLMVLGVALIVLGLLNVWHLGISATVLGAALLLAAGIAWLRRRRTPGAALKSGNGGHGR